MFSKITDYYSSFLFYTYDTCMEKESLNDCYNNALSSSL